MPPRLVKFNCGVPLALKTISFNESEDYNYNTFDQIILSSYLDLKFSISWH